MVVSGGGTNSDLQQAARRALGNPNNERDGVERAMPWVALGLAAVVLIVVGVNSVTGGDDHDRSDDREETAVEHLVDRADAAGLEVQTQDVARVAGTREATVVLDTDDGEVVVTWLQPPAGDLLVEVHQRDEVEGAVIEVGQGRDRLPRAVIDCGRSNLMISGELGLDADPADRQHRDPDGLDAATLQSVAERLVAGLDCPARMPAPSG